MKANHVRPRVVQWIASSVFALALATPARADTLADLRRADYVWVERMAWDYSAPLTNRSRSIEDACGALTKPAGQLAIVLNPANLGYSRYNFDIRFTGAVMAGGFVRWTVDPTSVPSTVSTGSGTVRINRVSGSIDTDVRAISPAYDDDGCGGPIRRFRVRLELRRNVDSRGTNQNRLDIDGCQGALCGTATFSITALAAELAETMPVTLDRLSIRPSRAPADPDHEVSANGTVSVNVAPGEWTYDVTLRYEASPSPRTGAITLSASGFTFTGAGREYGFRVTAPPGYVGVITVTATGAADGAVRTATFRLEGTRSDRSWEFAPLRRQGRPLTIWEIMPDPAPDVWRTQPRDRNSEMGKEQAPGATSTMLQSHTRERDIRSLAKSKPDDRTNRELRTNLRAK